MLIMHVPDTLQHPASNRITQIFRRSLGMNRTQIYGPVHALHPHPSHPPSHPHAYSHAAHVRRRERVRTDIRAKGTEMGSGRRQRGRGHEGLGSGSLCLMGGSLLGFGDVGTAVFTKVDTFTGPAWFVREGVYYLEYL